MDFEKAKRERDEKLKYLLLAALHNAKKHGVDGSVEGRWLVENVQTALPRDDQFEDEGHAISVIRDLVDLGLVSERFEELNRGETFRLRHMRLRITAKGSQLVNKHIDPIAGIWDERIVDDRD